MERTPANTASTTDRMIAGGDLAGLYLRETSYPGLTAEQEATLARRIQRGLQAEVRLRNDGRDPRRRRELERLVEDGRRAMAELVEANVRLVLPVARQFAGHGVEFHDLIQEGNLGLIHAARKFDPDRGRRFSTYATWWIRQAISRALAQHSRTIRVPGHVHDDVVRMKKFFVRFQLRHGRGPTDEEVAEALDVPLARVALMKKFLTQPASLDAPAVDDEEETLGETLADPETPAPEDEALRGAARSELLRILERELTPSQEKVLLLRYGLWDGVPRTLKEIGRMMGVTRERVRQIEQEALERLRRPECARLLADLA